MSVHATHYITKRLGHICIQNLQIQLPS